MNEHALVVLEYPKIVELLTGFATSILGQERVRLGFRLATRNKRDL